MNQSRTLILTMLMFLGLVAGAHADMFINVMAINGSSERKETAVRYNLPGDLKVGDIIDTNGMELEYNVSDANYYVHASVTLDPKESKTFRIRIRDVWKITPDKLDDIQKQINEGYDRFGKVYDPAKAELLKADLTKRLDFIVQQQNAQVGNIERRIDAFREYIKEVTWIKNQALAVDYWRSNPGENKEKLIRMNIEVTNPATSTNKMIKEKHYLPAEVKSEHVKDSQGFETRFDEQKQQVFLFKEEEIEPGQKKDYVISIRDVWFLPQRDIDYLRSRAEYVQEFLKNSKYSKTSQFLFDRVNVALTDIERTQAQQKDIIEHIGFFRVNTKTIEQARTDVDGLEKILAIYREELQKTKVENVLQKVRSLNGLSSMAKAVFAKKPTESISWTFILWILVFVGVLTLLNYVVWLFRSKEKQIVVEVGKDKKTEDKPEKVST